MALVLPSTVEELNQLQNSVDILSPMYVKTSNQGFENIVVEKRLKREVSLPNGVENWNISNYDSYLNFEDNQLSKNLEVNNSANDRLVPEEGDQRSRCASISSVSSNMDEKQLVFQNFGVKTFNTVCMDSGSTCISSDHSYVNPTTSIFKGLDAEETYQNLDMFLQQVPEMNATDTLSSSLSSVSSPGNSNFEQLSALHNSFALQDTMLKKTSSAKRSAETSSDDEIFMLQTAKRACEEASDDGHYHEVRRKNNIASKNCRKTRKEKQKEMEVRVAELEKEKEGLKVEVQVLEELIQAHKVRLYAILQKR